MTNNKQLSLIDALCILRTGYKTQQESELCDHAYLVIKQHSETLHLEYQRECIDEKLIKIKEDDNQKRQIINNKMKNILLATLLIGMMGGCEEPTIKSKTTNYTIPSEGDFASDPLKVCVIEGCEYFICKNYKGNILCHKGNCKNPIHKGGNK